MTPSHIASAGRGLVINLRGWKGCVIWRQTAE